MSEEKLGLSLIDTINSTALPEITKDLAEVALDSILDNGILRDLPIVNTIIGLSKTAVSIRDRFLIQKIASFLRATRPFSEKEREDFSKKIETEPNYRQEVGEHLIVLLDRLDDKRKPEMIAKLFLAYLKDDITYTDFIRFSSIVEKAFINDLQGFLSTLSEDFPRMRNPYTSRLYYLGLSEIIFDDTAYQKKEPDQELMGVRFTSQLFNQSKNPIHFRITEEAYVMAQIILGKKIHGIDYLQQYKSSRDSRLE